MPYTCSSHCTKTRGEHGYEEHADDFDFFGIPNQFADDDFDAQFQAQFDAQLRQRASLEERRGPPGRAVRHTAVPLATIVRRVPRAVRRNGNMTVSDINSFMVPGRQARVVVPNRRARRAQNRPRSTRATL